MNPVDIDPILSISSRPPKRDVLAKRTTTFSNIFLSKVVAGRLFQTKNAANFRRVK